MDIINSVEIFLKSILEQKRQDYSKDYYNTINEKIKELKKIDLKLETPQKSVDISSFKYKVLFLSFNIKLHTYGETDHNNMFRGYKQTDSLFIKLFKERLGEDVYINFSSYDKVSRFQNEYYIDNDKLKNYDFVFFGFMANYTNICSLLINFVEKNNICHMKYDTYNHFHNKAYQFDLLESLGFNYIPSILTSTLNDTIIKNVELFKYPVVVKDVNLDRGEGIWKINNYDELKNFFSQTKKLYLIQKFIPNDGEWRVITIKNKTVLIAKKNKILDISKKNIDDRKSVKGELPEDVICMCENISKHLFSDIIGLDIIQDINDEKYYILETNSSPHFYMFSLVTGISIPDKIVDYIIQSIKR